MDDSYIFLVVLVSGKPPNGIERRAHRKDYIFSPLGGNSVFTVDIDSWESDQYKLQRSFFPNYSEYNLIASKGLELKEGVLVGLSNEKKLMIPGRGAATLEKFIPSENFENQSYIGYDVVDAFGLSALVNIGYTSEEMSAIEELGIEIGCHGLIRYRDDAIKFARFAESSAMEHAPFYPINVLSLNKYL